MHSVNGRKKSLKLKHLTIVTIQELADFGKEKE